MSSNLPWQIKIAAKIVLSRIPAGYDFWRRARIFRHGDMDDPAYALSVFQRHFSRVGPLAKEPGFTALELGPGDTLFSAMIAKAHGAAMTFLVDVGPFAIPGIEPYRQMAKALEEKGLSLPGHRQWQSLDDVLACCQARYLTRGLESLQCVPDGSVDFIWSQAVLEHIRLGQFWETMRQVRRVLSPQGVCSHRVDLQDHLGGGLNNLRFPEKFWEARWMARSGFYTNRIRFSRMLDLFQQAGFFVEVVGAQRWDALPLPRTKMAREFRDLPEQDLRVSGFDVLLTPA